MQTEPKHGKMLTVKDGYLVCPICRRNKHLQPVLPETVATHLQVYCRICKSHIIVDMSDGQCFKSQC